MGKWWRAWRAVRSMKREEPTAYALMDSRGQTVGVLLSWTAYQSVVTGDKYLRDPQTGDEF